MSEHIVHRGGDWEGISGDLPYEDPYTKYLRAKSRESSRQFGRERPFGETVTPDQAKQIRGIAKRRGFNEIKGEAK